MRGAGAKGNHAARLMKMSGRSVSRGIPRRDSIVTARSALMGLFPLMKDRMVDAVQSKRSASSEAVRPWISQYLSSGSQRLFLRISIPMVSKLI